VGGIIKVYAKNRFCSKRIMTENRQKLPMVPILLRWRRKGLIAGERKRQRNNESTIIEWMKMPEKMR
jgi:hypothetical protein